MPEESNANIEWLLKTTPEEDDELLPEEQTLIARIPALAGNNKKVAYLGYRSCGFTVGQACELAGCTKTSVHNWRKSDPVFARWENEELPRLQKDLSVDIIKFEFTRNFRMLLKSDMLLIAKGLSDLENLTSREYELFKSLRQFYKPSELLAIEKILAPERHSNTPTVIKLSWGSRLDSPVIEGEVKELTDGEYREEGSDL